MWCDSDTMEVVAHVRAIFGNEIDPYRALFPVAQAADGNPYHVFLQSWEAYWRASVISLASAAETKIVKFKQWPTSWETVEINAE